MINYHWFFVDVNIETKCIQIFDSIDHRKDIFDFKIRKILRKIEVFLALFILSEEELNNYSFKTSDKQISDNKGVHEESIDKTSTEKKKLTMYLFRSSNESIDQDNTEDYNKMEDHLVKSLKSFWNYKLIDSPIQTNSYDCGIYMLKMIKDLIIDSQIIKEDYTSETLPYVRNQIAIEILNSKLII